MDPLPNTYEDQGCFFCGRENPIGPHLQFWKSNDTPDELICRWTPPISYKGWSKVLHGGIQTGLFDEIMGWATHKLLGRMAMTSSLSVDFLKPLYVEKPLEVRCRVDGVEGRRVSLSAEIRDHRDRLCSRAVGVYVMLKDRDWGRQNGAKREG